MPKEAQARGRRADDILTLREIEAQYPVSARTIRKRVQDGSIPERRIVGRRIVVRRGDLERVLYGGPAPRDKKNPAAADKQGETLRRLSTAERES